MKNKKSETFNNFMAFYILISFIVLIVGIMLACLQGREALTPTLGKILFPSYYIGVLLVTPWDFGSKK